MEYPYSESVVSSRQSIGLLGSKHSNISIWTVISLRRLSIFKEKNFVFYTFHKLRFTFFLQYYIEVIDFRGSRTLPNRDIVESRIRKLQKETSSSTSAYVEEQKINMHDEKKSTHDDLLYTSFV